MKRNRKCAAKIINISNMHTMFRTKYLPRELRILYDVRHQYLIEIYDIFNVDNLIFIFMEFATKSDLCDYLIRTARALSEPHSCKWFWQISTALNYLHCDKCIAHRDIKIENILITEDYTTKLTDFGFSAYVFMDGNNEPEQSHTYCGTKPYKSIQIAQMRPYNPFKADIWALGVVLFLLLNNHYPFHYNDMKLMVNEQLDCNFIPRRLKPTLSNSSKQLIMEMFEIDETKRIDTVNILKHQWLIEYLDQSLVISE
ncbi:hypothetical protein RDWZM_008623 [Blomia tropicalis]|uniref:Protein kinase domain-containing protein n=1 Tax=Blomia tropicalis TaxID=40697 RepID=A0A9Q0RLL2_BLOTA|nr:hypothetical protein RDWZM_008623 [Blomia tropicalis]